MRLEKLEFKYNNSNNNNNNLNNNKKVINETDD